LWKKSELVLMLGYQGAAMLLRSINSRTVAVLVNDDVHVKIMMICTMLLESSATGYQGADVTFCVVGVKSVSIEIQELWKTSELVLMLGYQGAAMLLRSINNRTVAVLVNDDVHVKVAIIYRMPYMTTGYQDADVPFCVVVTDGIGNWKRSSRRIL
jgi:hypothetical protein